MKKIVSFSALLLQELTSLGFFIQVFVISTVYMMLLITLLQIRIVVNIFQLPLSLIEKALLIPQTIWYAFTMLQPIEQVLFLLIALLVGINITLSNRKIALLRKQKNLHFSFGAGLISIVGAGCASCGFSILSLIGLGGAAAVLPFQGIELSILAVLLLLIILFYTLNSFYQACKVA